jgi:hypothetical protein
MGWLGNVARVDVMVSFFLFFLPCKSMTRVLFMGSISPGDMGSIARGQDMGFGLLLLLLVHYASSIDWIALFSFPEAARICRGEDVFFPRFLV